MTYAKARRDERLSTQVLIKAKCPKCGKPHEIYDYRDDGHISRVFCRHHRGLRQMEYFPTAEISPDIRLRA